MNAFPQPTFLGTGWSFPIAADPLAPPAVALVSGEDDVHQSIWLILATAPGERLLRPTFGCAIHHLVFAPASAETLGRVRAAVGEALSRWEPRIDPPQVEVEVDATDASILQVRLAYRVRATGNRYNLVFPFYLGGTP